MILIQQSAPATRAGSSRAITGPPHRRGVLLVSYAEYPGPIGLSRRIEGLQSVLSINGIPSEVLCLTTAGPGRCERIHDLGLPFSGMLLQSSLGRAVALLLFSFLAIPKIALYSRRGNLLIQYESLFSALPAIVAKMLLGKKIIGDEAILISSGSKPPLCYVLRALDRALVRMTDHVTTSSTSAYLQIVEWFPNKPAYIVPNGVTAVTRERSSSLDMGEMIFVGSLSAPENRVAVENTLRLAKTLVKRGIRFHISVVGGPIRFALPYLRHETVRSGKVTFLGTLSDEELSTLYRRVSIGLLPFFRASYGGQRMKGLEYLANGLLVISGPYGFGCSPGTAKAIHYLEASDIEEMSEIISRCLSEPLSYSHLPLAGQQFVEKTCSWAVVAAPYLDAIRVLLRS